MPYLRRPPRPLVIDQRVVYNCELTVCPVCNTPLVLAKHYTWAKTVQHLDAVVYVASRPKECVNRACAQWRHRYPSVVAETVALPRATYGLDVIAQIGWWRDREQLSGAEIYVRLGARVQQISRRQVDLLVQQYRVLLACAERPSDDQLRQAVATYGGLILSLDGLEPEGGQEQLWAVRELFTGTLLLAAWLPRVNEDTLAAVLTPLAARLRAAQWPVLATVSDKQACLEAALTQVWPTTPHQWCQAHYLRNAAEPLHAHDRALQVDLRREVRQAVRPSLRQVTVTAAAGDFAPQVVTGWLVGQPPVAVGPRGADAPAAEPRGADAPAVGPRGADAPATGPAATDASTAGVAAVVQGYAQVLQTSLGRTSQNVFDLAGLHLYEDLQAIGASLQRCCQQHAHPVLQTWQTALARILPAYATPFAEVAQAHTWLAELRDVFDQAQLPTRTRPSPGAATVAHDVTQRLTQLSEPVTPSPWLTDYQSHLRALTTRYAAGLFVCYDVVGVPRTNNALETVFGQTRRQVRRQSGFKQVRRILLRHGAWLLYQPDDSVAALQDRLQQVAHEAYDQERRRFEARQQGFRNRYRWQHDRTAVLNRLEQLWTC
jgi:hypothetical protein